jgi:uncharacterized membrane protein
MEVNKMKKILIGLMFVLMLLPMVLASNHRVDLDTTISSEDQAQFDDILEPVMKIYNFIKYIASVVAVIFLLYAGISFMTSGSDPRKRDASKNIAMYVIIGLLIIWAAPMIVNLLI